MSHAGASRIVVFLPNWVGDVVMATPALRALRSAGDAHLTYFGRRVALDTLDGTTWADEMIVDESKKAPRVLAYWKTARRLRRGRFDLAVLLPNSFRVAVLARAGGIRRLAGYDRDGRGWLLSDKLSPLRDEKGAFRPLPTIDYYNALIERIGVAVGSRRMELPTTSEGEAKAEALLKEAGADSSRPIVMLNPGASFGPSKMWAPDRYAAVADALIDRQGAQIIINAAPNERAIAAEVAAAMKRKPLLSFADRDNTLAMLKSLVRRCRLLITNDTGVRHFGAAFGIGVVTLFGSTDPVWAQIDYDQERLVRVGVPCSPCQKKHCPQPPGPVFHQCMSAITPEMVLKSAEELLARSGGRP